HQVMQGFFDHGSASPLKQGELQLERPFEYDCRHHAHEDGKNEDLLESIGAIAETRNEGDGESGRDQTAVMAEQDEGHDAQDNADRRASIGKAGGMPVMAALVVVRRSINFG